MEYCDKLKRFFIDERHRWLFIKKGCGPLYGEEPKEFATYETKLVHASVAGEAA